MRFKRFEEIISWQKGFGLALLVYKYLKHVKDYSFKDQIQRAAVSISNNIAEGNERRTNKEFINFLYIAKGSCGEVRSMVMMALSLDYIDEDKYKEIYDLSEEVSRLISGLIKIL